MKLKMFFNSLAFAVWLGLGCFIIKAEIQRKFILFEGYEPTKCCTSYGNKLLCPPETINCNYDTEITEVNNTCIVKSWIKCLDKNGTALKTRQFFKKVRTHYTYKNLSRKSYNSTSPVMWSQLPVYELEDWIETNQNPAGPPASKYL